MFVRRCRLVVLPHGGLPRFVCDGSGGAVFVCVSFKVFVSERNRNLNGVKIGV